MTSILITGGAGFIGSAFTRWVLSHSDYQIYVLDALRLATNPDSIAGLGNRMQLFVGELADQDLVDDLVAKSDYVINFAAQTHNDWALAHPELFIESNISGLVVLLQACTKYGRRFHQLSTDEVFGPLSSPASPAFEVDSPYRPSNPYSATKAGADHLVRAWHNCFGLPATISMSGNNYGPRQQLANFIPRQITNLLLGRKPVLYGDGSQIRDWLAVDDHCAALWLILHNGEIGQHYLVSANQPRSNREVVELLLAEFGLPNDHVDYVADRAGHDRRYALADDRLTRSLGWQPAETDFAAGLAKTLRWYADNRDWWAERKALAEDWLTKRDKG